MTLGPLELRGAPDPPENDALAEATRAVTELRTSFEEFRTRTDERLATETRTITARLDDIETRAQRPGGTGGERRDETAELECRAFVGYVRGGRERLQADEVRALRVADDTSGGYLAPPTFIAEMMRNLVEMSPIRAAARVGNMSTGAVILPRRVKGLTAKWVGEIETRPATQPEYGQLELLAHEMSAYVDVSMWLLEDAATNIEVELALDFAEEFGRLEGQSFVLGTGVKQPLGLMSDPGILSVANGHATTLSADALISLLYAVPTAYRNRGSWLMNGTTITALRLLKDGSGAYIWQPSLADGQPATLLGRPIVEAPDMPDIAANATPIAYGDMQAAFRIYDRIGAPGGGTTSVRRYDDAQLAENGLVRFHGRRRLAAGVVRPDAVRKLAMTA